jgi:basic amino acid/polyamine antiporter, APA family
MPESDARPGLERVLGLREGIAIHVGLIIGSGIFIVPATMAGRLPAMGPLLLVWAVAGLLTLFGALTLAELSSILPGTGGPYLYLRHSFGRIWAFLFTWNDFFINKAGSTAALAVAFATFLGYLVPGLSPSDAVLDVSWPIAGRPVGLSISSVQVVAVAVIAITAAINVRGVRLAGWVMTVFTAAKVAVLVGIVVAAAWSSRSSAANLGPWWPAGGVSGMGPAFGLAMISALWAYDGWMSVTLTAGEIRNPQRNVPLSLLVGTLVVIGLYVSANLAYASVVPLAQMASSPRIAADVGFAMLGPAGALVVTIGVMCSTFGTANGEFLTGPRSVYAAGHDGLFPARFGEVHPRFRTPAFAVVTMGVFAAALALTGTFEQITSYIVFVSWGFYALTAASVIVLRRTMPDAPRPYRAWGYPYATIAFVAVAAVFVLNTLVADTRNALVGIGLMLLSLPFYAWWTRGGAPRA